MPSNEANIILYDTALYQASIVVLQAHSKKRPISYYLIENHTRTEQNETTPLHLLQAIINHTNLTFN